MSDMIMQSEWQKTIEDTKKLLVDNDEWHKRYAEYADIIFGKELPLSRRQKQLQ